MTSSGTGNPAAGGAVHPQITDDQQRAIHHAAAEYVAAEILRRPARLPDPTLGGAAGQSVMGAFVTLKRRGRLRSCCGTCGQPLKLAEALRYAATRTATQDVRLPRISPTELRHLDLDVSLLHTYRPVTAQRTARVDEVQVGRHGLQIRRGGRAGLLLPSVATEHGLDAEQFLRQVCVKAGLPTTAWREKDAELLTFETLAIPGRFSPDVLPEHPQPVAPITGIELKQLADLCRANILALWQGATPNYYLPGCSDGTVEGIALTAHLPAEPGPLECGSHCLRPGLPLQATLFQLAEIMAARLRARGTENAAVTSLEVGLIVLFDPAMHGTVADADLEGIDARQRAVVVTENHKTAWAFDPQRSKSELLTAARDAAQVTVPQAANVLSMAALSTEGSFVYGDVPRPQRGVTDRPPAVAGSFYPQESERLSQLVDELLTDGHQQPQPWPAAMVPHAGLRYSGRIAAAVLQRVEIPDTVIVIGPKHTRLGVEWAVAPHDHWSLPGGRVASHPQLAGELSHAIPGLQLDDAAHRQEHAIEVELPLLARLAPHARVVGIAIGAGNLQRCQQFASGLADVLRDQSPRPLLLISSDMNHYASDAENRRLDELAMLALERLVPGDVYQTVQQHKISMCGVLPAVIVLETLKQLGTCAKAERVAYGTSADVTGDRQRVVGYAGMLFG